MASAFELRGSRSGYVVGIAGLKQITRTFRVKCDTIAQFGDVVLQQVSGGVRYGDVHPEFPSMFAAFMKRRETVSPFEWEVVVEYLPPIVFAGANAYWSIQIDASLDTEEVWTDLDGVPFGAFNWLIQPGSDIPAGSIAGWIRYDDEATTPGGPPQVTQKMVAYFPQSKSSVRSEPFRRYVRGGTVTLTRIFPNMPSNLEPLLSSTGTVNDGPILVKYGLQRSEYVKIGSSETIMLVDVSVRQMTGTIVGQAAVGVVYQFSARFVYNHVGWNPVRVQSYEERAPKKYVVFDKEGKPITTKWRHYEKMDFNTMLAQLGSVSPRGK